MTFQETTTPLLRPAQAQEWKEQANALRQMLSAPPHIANRIEDRGQMTKNLRALEKDLQNQEPRPYDPSELDAAVSRSDQLKDEILEGMPTQQEMRRNPAGAVDKHRRWEKRNKAKLSEWKNIQLRRHQTGHIDLHDATDVANFEQFRPVGGSQQLNMHNEQIAGTLQYGPKPGAGPSVIMGEAEAEFLKTIAPDISNQLALMSNEKRQMVKDFINGLQSPAVSVSPEGGQTFDSGVSDVPRLKRKSGMSEEHRQAASDRMKARHAANRAARNQEG